MEFDLDNALKGLANFLKCNSEERKAVPRAGDIRALAQKLDAIADTLGKEKWSLLKSSVDWDPSGMPTGKSNAGRFDATRENLREIAAKAREEARFLPDRRRKDHFDWATDRFLMAWLDAGKDQPTLYEKSEGVVALERVFQDAGVFLSRERIIDLLRSSMKRHGML